MEIKLEPGQMQKKKLFIGLPMYAGQCCGIFTKSLVDLTSECLKEGIQCQTHFLFNESLITRARNYLADEFMRSDCTHMIFIDSDIAFSSKDVIFMLAMMDEMDENNQYDVVCGPYPKKNISWEKIKQAVDQGRADENPQYLEQYVGDYVFNIKSGVHQFQISEPVEVAEAGTGFMMIKRRVFEKFQNTYPLWYKPDHVRSEQFDGSRQIMMYFQADIDEETNRYLSEDYLFCKRAWDSGSKVWLCPWMSLQHQGSYIFGGSLAALASINANPTADPSKLVKTKKG